MTQEEKDILLKDLCGRLPYGVKVQLPVIYDEAVLTCRDISAYSFNTDSKIVHIPYLRPMSSMTEKEKEYIKNRWCYEDWNDIYNFLNHYQIDAGDAFSFVDWLNAHHFDYRGLIEKGLALPAPEGMYNF